MTQPSTRDGQAGSMPAGARTRRPMNTPKSMSFTITTDVQPENESIQRVRVRPGRCPMCPGSHIRRAWGATPSRESPEVQVPAARPDSGRDRLVQGASNARGRSIKRTLQRRYGVHQELPLGVLKASVEMGAPSLSVEGEGQRLRGRNRTYAPAGLSGVWAVAPPDAVGDQLGLVRVHERFRYGVLQRVSDGPDRCEHRMVDERLRVVGL